LCVNGFGFLEQPLPVFERGILLSSRKGVWDRVRKGLVPLSTGGRPDEGFLEQPHKVGKGRLAWDHSVVYEKHKQGK